MSIIARSTAKRRVANGCALLDKECPGWASRIDLSRLDIAGCDCVLGQLDAWESLGFTGFIGAATRAEDHGFFIDGDWKSMKDVSASYARLEKEWRHEIENRQ